MPIFQSPEVVPARPAPSGDASGEIMSVRGVVPLTVALLLADLIECVKLPAGHMPTDFIIETDDLDSNGAPLITLDCGVMSGTPGVVDVARTVGTEILAASTIAQTGGIVRPSAATAALAKWMRYTPVEFERSFGFKVAAAPATGVAALGSMTVNRGSWQPATVYTAADFITLFDGRRVKCTTGGTSAAATTGQPYPVALAQAVAGGTVADGTVTWTMSDPYIALTMFYRPQRYSI